MRRKKRAIGAAVVMAAVTGTMLVTAGAANAEPTDCHTWLVDSTHAASRCTGGTGHHAIWVTEQHPNPEIGTIYVEGDWAAVGADSIVQIPPFHIVEMHSEKVDW